VLGRHLNARSLPPTEREERRKCLWPSLLFFHGSVINIWSNNISCMFPLCPQSCGRPLQSSAVLLRPGVCVCVCVCLPLTRLPVRATYNKCKCLFPLTSCVNDPARPNTGRSTAADARAYTCDTEIDWRSMAALVSQLNGPDCPGNRNK